MGGLTLSATETPHCQIRCTLRWPFDKNASDMWMRRQLWATHIW